MRSRKPPPGEAPPAPDTRPARITEISGTTARRPAGCALTVIIPTYNRAAIAAKCLDALTRQTLPARDFEIIVSDDGSSDETRSMVDGFRKRSSHRIHYLWRPNRGQNAARNRALLRAQGRIALFINDDTILTPAAVAEHLQAHETFPDEKVAVLGKVAVSPELPRSLFSTLHLDGAFAAFQCGAELDWHAFITCNLSVKKSLLLTGGLFDEGLRYNDDLELGERLSHFGLRVRYTEKALGHHYHLLGEDDFFKLAALSGQTLAIWHKKSPHLKQELATVGFYLAHPLGRRVVRGGADLVINRMTTPALAALARFFSTRNETLARAIYRKLYKALERKSIRRELSR